MDTVINIQLSKEEMQKDFLTCLRKREIPSHFSYWGKDESQEWLKVCQSQDYEVYDKGLTLIEKNLPDIMKTIGKSRIKEINFISLGIGNGIKDAMILEELLKNHRNTKFFPIDISLDMLNAGMKNVPKKVETIGFVSDFRFFGEISSNIRENHYPQHFVSILGNTLGNFGQVEILNNLRGGMNKKDYLLIEITLRKDFGSKMRGEDLTQIIESYNNEDYKSFVFKPLQKAGFKREDGVIEVEYGPNQYYPKLYSIEIWFRLTKDKVVHYTDREVIFKKDERILLYVSHKYTQENIRELLDGNGFEVVREDISDDQGHGLFLSRLKE